MPIAIDGVMEYVQRFYLDGKLHKTTKPADLATLRRWLDNIARHWSADGVFPLTPAGEFDCNKAHSVTRVSDDELIIVNTSGKMLRFINVERKAKS